jgi:hypothetical protein
VGVPDMHAELLECTLCSLPCHTRTKAPLCTQGSTNNGINAEHAVHHAARPQPPWLTRMGGQPCPACSCVTTMAMHTMQNGQPAAASMHPGAVQVQCRCSAGAVQVEAELNGTEAALVLEVRCE